MKNQLGMSAAIIRWPAATPDMIGFMDFPDELRDFFRRMRHFTHILLIRAWWYSGKSL